MKRTVPGFVVSKTFFEAAASSGKRMPPSISADEPKSPPGPTVNWPIGSPRPGIFDRAVPSSKSASTVKCDG